MMCLTILSLTAVVYAGCVSQPTAHMVLYMPRVNTPSKCCMFTFSSSYLMDDCKKNAVLNSSVSHQYCLSHVDQLIDSKTICCFFLNGINPKSHLLDVLNFWPIV